MRPFRIDTTAKVIVAYLRGNGYWRTTWQIYEGADLAWYSPLWPALWALEKDGVLESRWLNSAAPYPRKRLYRFKDAT